MLTPDCPQHRSLPGTLLINYTESKNSSQHNQWRKAHRNGYASPIEIPNIFTKRALTPRVVSRSPRPQDTRLSRAPTPSSAATTGMLFTATPRLWYDFCCPQLIIEMISNEPIEGAEGRQARDGIRVRRLTVIVDYMGGRHAMLRGLRMIRTDDSAARRPNSQGMNTHTTSILL